MYTYNETRKLRIKRRLVAIISVILTLTLVTTISYNTVFQVYAAGEEKTQEDVNANNGDEQPAADAQTESDIAAEEIKETLNQDETESGKEKAADGNAAKEGEQPADGTEQPADGTEQAAEEEPALTPEEEQALREAEEQQEYVDAVIDELGLTGPAQMPDVTASSYIVMSGSTSEVVLEQHPQRKMSPGRITMLMTAMVVIDNMYNEEELNNRIEITEKIASYGNVFNEGESLTVGELLDAMLVGGSEEAAEALSRYSASKRKIFINMMNSKAMELGLMDTQFSNPSGAYNAKQYSTAADCAVIMQAAYRYSLIRQAFTLETLELNAESKDSARVAGFRSTNPLLLNDDLSARYKYTKGGISGSLAQPVNASQYAGIAVSDDMQLIVVLMDSRASQLAYEAKGLLRFANTIVTKNVIVQAGKKVGTARVRGGAVTRAAAYTETKGFAYVPPEGSEDLITTKIVMDSNLEAPLSKGDKVGEFRIYVADELKGTVDLVLHKDIEKGWFLSRIYISNTASIVIGVVLLIVLILTLRILYVRAKRKRIKRLRREQQLRDIAMRQMEIDEDRKRRNWTYGTSYEQVAPRTVDLRREAIAAELEEQDRAFDDVRRAAERSSKQRKKDARKEARTQKKREAARKKNVRN